MLRWGILLILLGLVVAMFLSGSAGGAMVDIGKWLVGAAIIIWIIWMVIGGTRSGPGTYGPP